MRIPPFNRGLLLALVSAGLTLAGLALMGGRVLQKLKGEVWEPPQHDDTTESPFAVLLEDVDPLVYGGALLIAGGLVCMFALQARPSRDA